MSRKQVLEYYGRVKNDRVGLNDDEWPGQPVSLTVTSLWKKFVNLLLFIRMPHFA